ncbi:Similar to hypothetical protein [Podospora anserina S mat+]; acc. no. XP_001906035 [Pyronema omphalodes CBS 100304]|uniref:Uncharacterized protein n=1 Tax=Pyronema omphalodes (strain CBS 100304) TaxID=1076935 RepID=U4L6W6_PYROM|nr:Similar to hypothetical protein [Podospora anserina S mat+]; acc. no. XP_001906035 [Pyronema omphalodes CBS 100304]
MHLSPLFLLITLLAPTSLSLPAPTNSPSEPDCFYILDGDGTALPVSQAVIVPLVSEAESASHSAHSAQEGKPVIHTADELVEPTGDTTENLKKPVIHLATEHTENTENTDSNVASDKKPVIHTTDESSSPSSSTENPVIHTTTSNTTGDIPPPPGFIIQPKIGTAPKSPGGKILKQRFGPYVIPGGGKVGEYTDVPSPCPEGGCYITALESSLEYESGAEANIDTGAWLHHMVLVLYGKGRQDLVCGENPFGELQPIFASGNERATARLDNTHPAGIHLRANDTLALSTELMNQSPILKQVWLTVTLEYTFSPGYQAAELIWLDAAGCFGSDVPAKEGAYELRSKPWVWTGAKGGKGKKALRLLGGGGHVHDGGEQVTILKNNATICDSVQLYGRTSAYRESTQSSPSSSSSGSAHHHKRDGGLSHTAMQHISDSGRCSEAAMGIIKPGDMLQAGIANIYVTEINQ